MIPGGTVSTLQDSWRVVDLGRELVLVPGTYQLAGLDTAESTDPIRFMGGLPSRFTGSPPGFYHPSVEGGKFSFFYSGTNQLAFGPTPIDKHYLATGIELGPMLFTIPEHSSYAWLTCICLLWHRRSRKEL